ncbi:hypothetical protein DEU34_2245 [Microbacterium sp. AG1240]|nr:hypothetical protein [Microbacterium sp. AG1240]RKT33642.1 hypothetical protein DEU34_2245 [Microbacterium sp. AG1240]
MVDRKAQLIVTCMFRHLTDQEKSELTALLGVESDPNPEEGS